MDRPTFLKHLRRSGLVAPADIAAAVQQLPPDDRGRAVARAFVASMASRMVCGSSDSLLQSWHVMVLRSAVKASA